MKKSVMNKLSKTGKLTKTQWDAMFFGNEETLIKCDIDVLKLMLKRYGNDPIILKVLEKKNSEKVLKNLNQAL